jgi:hypothetical protein
MAADFLGPGQCDTIWAQHTPENRYRHKEKPVTLSPNPRVERRVRATTTQSRRRTARGRDNAVWDISQACSEMLPSPFDALKYVKMVCFPKKGLQASCPRQCHLPIHPFPKGSKELVIQSPGVTGHPAGWGGGAIVAPWPWPSTLGWAGGFCVLATAAGLISPFFPSTTSWTQAPVPDPVQAAVQLPW